MAFKMNQISCDLASYPYYMLLSPRKFGKTTWWRNLVVAAWGNASKGLLISCGTESGFHHLDNLQVEEALTWDDDYDEETGHRGLIQIVDDLIENNADYGIKGVCFDTFDTLFDIATDEVMRESRRETGKSCKSINDAFGGYNRGSDRLIKIINDQLSRIRNAGIAVFILSHTKFKERTDPSPAKSMSSSQTSCRTVHTAPLLITPRWSWLAPLSAISHPAKSKTKNVSSICAAPLPLMPVPVSMTCPKRSPLIRRISSPPSNRVSPVLTRLLRLRISRSMLPPRPSRKPPPNRQP